MRLLISFAALLLSVVFVQLGSGALGPLDALSGAALGFSTAQIGLLGSAHFVGFFIGCWAAPRMMGGIGHSRAFAAFAASGAIGALGHPLWHDPWFWSALRVLTGIAVAGRLHGGRELDAGEGDQRHARAGGRRLPPRGPARLPGRAGADRGAAAGLLHLLQHPRDPLLPLPAADDAHHREGAADARRAAAAPDKGDAALAPRGGGGGRRGHVDARLPHVGPIYGQQVGLDRNGIALFLAAAVLGGAVSQLPVGWIADKFDRRHVLTGISALSVVVCAAVAFDGGSSVHAVFLGAFAFGLFAFPIFSISSAHANDFAEPDFVAELNASLMFIYGVGAIASPLVAALLLERFGPGSLFAFIAALHLGLMAFGVMRMIRGRSAGRRTPYRYLPRTSFIIGRLVKRRRDPAPRA